MTSAATWAVSEPTINLWLVSQPLGYEPTRGKSIAFKLTYKQRGNRAPLTNIFNLGPSWNSYWLSFVEDTTPGSGAVLLAPGGGERIYVPDGSTVDPRTHTVMQRLTQAGNLTGFIVSYPNGSQNIYTRLAGTSPVRAYLTEQDSASGITNRFL